MKMAVIGQGGREYALCYGLAKSSLCTKLYCLPGSDAIARLASIEAIKIDDNKAIIDFVKKEKIDLVVIGPELPLTLGLADKLRDENILVFGPSAKAAKLEGSKGFARDFCNKYNIPAPDYAVFSDLDAALAYIEEQPIPIVVKADGLASGKGVVVAFSKEEARNTAKRLINLSNHHLVIESYLQGDELSFFAICDGNTALPMMEVQDYKRAFDGNYGPNTGGMGTYAPVPFVDKQLENQIMETIVRPTLAGMKADGTPYHGILYCGLMLTEAGPKLFEYNVRFGDPECQVLISLLQNDLGEILYAAAKSELHEKSLRWHQNKIAICVVLAANGYPLLLNHDHDKIDNLNKIEAKIADDPDIYIFHAGTKLIENSKEEAYWQANGGRVLNIVACAKTHEKARQKAYDLIDDINWVGGFYRKDIGKL